MTELGTEKNTREPRVVLHDSLTGDWLEFSVPLAIYTTATLRDVVPLLQEMEARVECEQLYAAGFIAYEAAPAFDPALPVRADAEFPLMWFGLFSSVQVVPAPVPTARVADTLHWRPESSHAEYDVALREIRDAIQSGETYQVNYSYRLRTNLQGDSWALFCELAGKVPFAAYVQTGSLSMCSFSPELFFKREGACFESRPMKGTRPRGVTVDADLAQRDALVSSEKERAENVMIVDMVRNDFGRIARPCIALGQISVNCDAAWPRPLHRTRLKTCALAFKKQFRRKAAHRQRSRLHISCKRHLSSQFTKQSPTIALQVCSQPIAVIHLIRFARLDGITDFTQRNVILCM
jgi:anthranilate/para-aminobenzoate synthase component I